MREENGFGHGQDGKASMCPVRTLRKFGAGGGTRTLTSLAAQRIFLPSTAFAARRGALKRTRQVCGLDYPFTVPRKSGA